MLRRQIRRIIPGYAALPLILTGLMNLIAYQLTKLLQFIWLPQMTDMTTELDRAIPFCPVWVYVYLGTFLFWIYQNVTVARENPEAACRLAAADLTAKVVCFLFFVFLPTTNVRPEVTTGGLTGFLMRFVYWIDTPTNLFPSIHCFVAWLGTRMLFESRHLKHKHLTCTLCVSCSVLVFLSTLFTKQHVIWDIFAGVVVAELGFCVAKYTPLTKLLMRWNERLMETRVGQFLCDGSTVEL